MSTSIVGIVVNLSPYVFGLARVTSMKLMQALDHVSRAPSVVTAELDAMITTNLVRAINTLVEEHKPDHGRSPLWARFLCPANDNQKTRTFFGLFGNTAALLSTSPTFALGQTILSVLWRSKSVRKALSNHCSLLMDPF